MQLHYLHRRLTKSTIILEGFKVAYASEIFVISQKLDDILSNKYIQSSMLYWEPFILCDGT